MIETAFAHRAFLAHRSRADEDGCYALLDNYPALKAPIPI